MIHEKLTTLPPAEVLTRARQFTWARTASITLDVYRQLSGRTQ